MVLRSCKVKGPVESLNVWSTGGGQCSQLSGANVLTLRHWITLIITSTAVEGWVCVQVFCLALLHHITSPK